MSINISNLTHLTHLIKYFSINRISVIFAPKQNELFVGRWITPNSNNKKNIDIMVDRNNDDHCGGCDVNSIKNNDIIKSEDDDYYRAFFM
jgi:hypothetical protein